MMGSLCRRTLPFVAIALLISGSPRSARSADESDRITVTATGRATVNPDVVELRATVSGSAPLAEDALKRFRENRRRGLQAINGMKMADLKVEGGGLSVQSTRASAQAMLGIGNNANAAQPNTILVSETLTIRLGAIDRLKEEQVIGNVAKIVDAVKDAGMTFSSKPMNIFEMQMGGDSHAKLALFKSTKLDETRAAAVRDAMQEARKKAEAMASAAQTTLGRVLSTRETVAAPSSSNPAAGLSVWYAMMGAESGDHSESDALASSELKPIAVNVPLEVQFATGGK